MDRSRVIALLVLTLLSATLACGVVGWRLRVDRLMTTGVDALFGQIYLTRESAPVSAREYASNEVLLGGLQRADELDARLVVLPQETYRWDPAYAGFAQVPLSDEQAIDLLAAMTEGPVFTDPYAGRAGCFERSATGEAEEAACDEAAIWQQIHDESRMSASMNPGMAALQLRLPDGRIAEYRMYSAGELVAYSTVELNEPALQGFIPSGRGLVDPLVARALIPPGDVLWPELSAERANLRAARRLGGHYQEAVELLDSLETLRQVVGEVREVRPAAGEGGNWSSTWMDSSSLQLLLWVRGDEGEGVVRMAGWECWDAEMMAEGKLIDLTSGLLCPDR